MALRTFYALCYILYSSERYEFYFIVDYTPVKENSLKVTDPKENSRMSTRSRKKVSIKKIVVEKKISESSNDNLIIDESSPIATGFFVLK